MMTHDCAIDPNFKIDDHEMNEDPLCRQMTVETFEEVVNKPATAEELSAVNLARSVVNHKNATLVLKSILHQMLSHDWEGTQETVNAAVHNHPINEPALTQLLDIKTRVDG